MKVYFIFFLLITVIIVCFGLSYYVSEKPTIEKSQESSNISILVLNEKHQQIIANYTLIINGEEYSKRQTLKDDFIQEKLPINSSILLFIEKDNYYPYKEFIYTKETPLIRKEIELSHVGNLSTYVWGSLFDNTLIVDVMKSGEVHNVVTCFRWSSNILNVNLKDYELLTDFQSSRFFYDKCYKIDDFVDSTKLDINVKRFGDLTNADYIKLYLLDGDEISSSNGQIVYSFLNNSKEEDIYMKDLELIINK